MQKVINLTLARHGNTFEAGENPRFVGKRTDLALTEFGKEQAKKIASFLKNEKTLPQKIFCSSLKRQRQTAEVICNELGLTNSLISLENSLVEIDYGLWENLSSEEIKLKWQAEFNSWELNNIWPEKIFATKESDFESSIINFMENLKSENSENMLLVTSNGVLRKIFNLISKKDPTLTAKVGTGCLCRLEIKVADNLSQANVKYWNLKPE